MRRHDRKRLQRDAKIDALLETPEGRQTYWKQLAELAGESSMCQLLESTLSLPGNVIECGVFRGSSLMKIGRVVGEQAPEKTIFGCDSFEGFPEDKVGKVDVGFLRFLSRIRRKFRVCQDTPARLERFFELYNLQGELVRGYFSETLGRFENEQFCFIHLDVDLYESYRECLHALYDRLTPGGVVVFDEYQEPNWPGADKAIDEFFADKQLSPQRCRDRSSPAWFIRKPDVETEQLAAA